MKKILSIVLSLALLLMVIPFGIFTASAEIVATDTWDGTKVEPTEVDADGNIVIKTAEELAWVALQGGDATANKNYKVAPDSVFDLGGMEGVTPDSTVADVKAATKSTTNLWHLDADGSSPAFQGNFDGNGLTVYNLYTGAGRSHNGLFPATHSAAQGSITIKNITVLASHIGAYHGAGAIVGIANTSNTSTKMFFEKCTVKNCLIWDNNDPSSATKRITGIIAGEISHNAATINNCLAVDNEISAQGIIGGFFGNNSNYAGQSTVSNSVSIGTAVAPTAINTSLATKVETTTYTYVYTDQATSQTGVTVLAVANMQGAASKDNMSLAWGTDWEVGAEGEYPSVIIKREVIEVLPEGYDKWDGTKVEPTEVDADGNIVIKTAEELAWVALQGGDATANKNYKVADDVKYFDLDGMEGIKLDSIVADVKAATKSTTKLWRLDADGSSPAFQGNFDGNGLTVYNLYTGAGRSHNGLFPATHSAAQGSITIKNITVLASHIGAYHGAGAIVGIANTSNTSTEMFFEQCTVKNCFIWDNNDPSSATKRITGIIAGEISHNAATINNCLAVDNEISAQGIIGGFFGNNSDYAGQSTVSNSVSIGTAASPVSIGTALATKVETTIYTNVYTDQPLVVDGITALPVENMQGALAKETMSLAWGTDWEVGAEGEYPSVIIKREVIEVLPEGYDKWDGTKVEPTTTDDEGNIIINTAEEFAWIALQGGDATANKNYKVADNSVFNMMGMEGINLNSTATDVKNAQQTTNYWQQDSAVFKGTLDGNGVVIYNVSSKKGQAYGGLFPLIANVDTSISNITVKASAFYGYHQVGGIVGLANGQKTINIENCVVKDCYLACYTSNDATCKEIGTIVGKSGNCTININNCLVADNIIGTACQYEVNILGGFVANSSEYAPKAFQITNSISIGTSPYPIVIGTGTIGKDIASKAVWSNVYTDQPLVVDGVTSLSTDDMKGAAAKENMNLNWGITWAVGAEGEYPSIILEHDFYDEWDGTKVEPTATDDEGNIIINTAEELAWVALVGNDATANKNYKVADGIKYFNMNGMVGITPNSTVNDVKASDTNDAFLWRTSSENKDIAFQGNFDGNGLTVFNLYTGTSGRAYSGLFPVTNVKEEGTSITIKNIKVTSSRVAGYHAAAVVIGLAEVVNSNKSLSIENIVVKNCYINDNNDSNPATQRTVSTLVGNVTHNSVVINNCFVIDNEVTSSNIFGGFFGNSSSSSTGVAVSDSIIIGTPATAIDNSLDDSHSINAPAIDATYTNVYTDEYANDNITVLELDEMKGDSAKENMNLDWANAWFATEDYPELRVFHNITVVDNEDGTHSESCEDCGIANDATAHIFVNGSCVCGAECSHDKLNDAVEENRVDSTCKVAGSYDSVVYCAVCGEKVSSETIELPLADHTEAEKEDNRIDSTCTTPGSYDKVTYCSVCDEVLNTEKIDLEINDENHIYGDDDICVECGADRDPIQLGDVNEDGDVNNRDLALLMQYVNGWEVDININVADVNADGDVNNRDLALLMQYVNGWEVKLG